jgi:hypothetical protein
MTKEQAKVWFKEKHQSAWEMCLNDPETWVEENRPLTPAELQYAEMALRNDTA